MRRAAPNSVAEWVIGMDRKESPSKTDSVQASAAEDIMSNSTMALGQVVQIGTEAIASRLCFTVQLFLFLFSSVSLLH